MKLFDLFLSLSVCAVLLYGCGASEVPSEVSEEPTQAILTLPDAFTLEQQNQGSYDILHNGQVIGGFVQTDLTQTDIRLGGSGGSSDTLHAYLESYIEPPLVMEYMAGGGICNVETQVSLITYDVEAKKGHEYDHFLFSRDSVCYDLWLDTELVSNDTRNHILITAGLYDSRVIFTPTNGFLEPEGYDITEYSADRCSIFREETLVGGLILTGQEALSLDDIDTDAYISTLYPYPEYFPEYIAMRGESFISITVKYTEEHTDLVRYTQHYLFIREGVCYDLWLDNDLIAQEERAAFLEAAGIQ